MIKHLLNIKPLLVLTFAVLALQFSANSQQYHTMYWMQGIPQATFSNPALQPNPNYFIGFPGVSSIYTGISHSGFAPFDVIKKSSETTFFIDDKALLARLKDRNYLAFDLGVDILAFGFRAKQKNYFTFSLGERVTSRLGYSRDLFTLAIEGNDGFANRQQEAEIGLFSLDMSHYREFAMGFSRQWSNRFNAGVRLKVLQGMGNIQSKRTDLNLFTEANSYHINLNTNLLINKSFPYQLAPIKELEDREELEFTQEFILDYISNSQNMGYAMDIGATYALNNRVTLAASAVNLGFIQWKSDVENISVQGEIDFKGLSFNQLFVDEDDEDHFVDFFDSIIDLFNINETVKDYNMFLTPRFFASAAFNLTRMHKFAIMGMGEVFAGTLYPSLTVSYNFQPLNRFGTALSYSIIHGNYFNVGFGAHINIMPLQIYMVMDNFFPALQPHTFQTFNIHFGVNIAAGFRRGKEDASAPRFRWY